MVDDRSQRNEKKNILENDISPNLRLFLARIIKIENVLGNSIIRSPAINPEMLESFLMTMRRECHLSRHETLKLKNIEIIQFRYQVIVNCYYLLYMYKVHTYRQTWMNL